MTFTKPVRSTRTLNASHRRLQTTVRWTSDEIRELRENVPQGMTLAGYIRAAALRRAKGLPPPDSGR